MRCRHKWGGLLIHLPSAAPDVASKDIRACSKCGAIKEMLEWPGKTITKWYMPDEYTVGGLPYVKKEQDHG